MGKRAANREEINALITQVLDWPDLAKFEVFDELRKDLAASFDPEHPEIRLTRERGEALVYLGLAIKHLGLPAREVPTHVQFDQVAKEQGWEWNGAKVIRVWERWKMATRAYLGTRQIGTPTARRRRRQKRGPEGQGSEKYLQALKTWLDSDPEVETTDAYNEFAEAYNQHLPEDALPLVRASTISGGLPVKWASAIRVARGEETLDEAAKRELAEHLPKKIDETTLVGLLIIARLLKSSPSKLREKISKDPDFPTPVAHFDGHPAWLYEDMNRYSRHRPVQKRSNGELQYSFLGSKELAVMLKFKVGGVRRSITENNWGRIPQPEGTISHGVHYWLREKVEPWIKLKKEHEQAKALERKEAQEQERQRFKAKRAMEDAQRQLGFQKINKTREARERK